MQYKFSFGFRRRPISKQIIQVALGHIGQQRADLVNRDCAAAAADESDVELAMRFDMLKHGKTETKGIAV